jgi:hypothetical protein
MSLNPLIERIRRNAWKASDYEHPLARCILEELSQGENDKFRRRLFNHVRKLSDKIISDYVQLDQYCKICMVTLVRSGAKIRTAKDYFEMKESGLKNSNKHE